MRSHKHRRSHQSVRTRLEALEDRCLLSTTYALTDLGTFGGAEFVQVSGLNNLGQVVLNATNSSNQVQGFLWSNGTVTSLGVLGPFDEGYSVNGVNDSGQVVGESTSGAFVWSNGTQTPLPLYQATAINDSGEIAGITENAQGEEAVAYDNGTITEIASPSSDVVSASAINSSGQVAGFVGPPATNLIYEAYLWSASNGLQTLGTLPGEPDSAAYGINDAGQVVGTVGADGTPTAFLYSNGQMVGLGTLPGGEESFGNAINNAGQVVGTASTASGGTFHAFVDSNGVMTDLNSLVPAGSGPTLTAGIAINNSGQIAADAVDAAGHEHVVLLTPVQSPSFTVTGFPSPTTAGVAGSFTVTAENANGTINTGYTGTVHFMSSDPQAVLPANYTFTTADQGVHTFSATLETAGSQSLTVNDTATTTISGTQSGITVTPAAATHLLIIAPAGDVAGTAFSTTVTAVDAFGNTATGYTGTVHFTSSDPQAALPANYTFTASNDGVHTFSATLKTAGSQSLTVTDTTTASVFGTLSGIAVTPAAATHFVITGRSSVAPSTAFSVTVTAFDAYGNIATGYLGTVDFSSSDSTATLPSNYTFKTTDKDVHIFTGLKLKKAGTQTITVKDTKTGSILGVLSITVT